MQRSPALPARIFLYIIAGLIMLALAAALGWNLFQDRLMRAAFVPSIAFAPPPDTGAPDYTRAAAWLSRPGTANDPSQFLPAGVAPADKRPVAVFYVPPTTYLRRDRWNAPLSDTESNGRLRLFASSQSSVFTGVGEIWAPRYRQATIGAFLTSQADAARALDFAYRDVAAAFDAFIASIDADRPILLAGHSQGSLHLTRLLAERIAGTPIAQRIVAAYAVGWPISLDADLPRLGLPTCGRADQANCIVGWQSFAEPADPRQIRDLYDVSTGFTGKPRKGTAMLCTNPLTGAPGQTALRSANRGALVPSATYTTAELKPGVVSARCSPDGLLLIGDGPGEFGRFVLPGNNYHVFDYALFWANIRADAEARTATFLTR